MIKLAVLISGNGGNLQAIIEAITADKLDAQIVLVVSSKPDVYGLKRAKHAKIPTLAMTKEEYADREAADTKIANAMKDAGADYVVMAGYMRLVGTPILSAFEDRVINLHPALLPSFPGAHGALDAFNYGVKVTGITIHFANEVYDEGPIIAQHTLPVLETDTPETLTERIHELEHIAYPEALQLIAEERVSITKDRKVKIRVK